MSLAQRLAELTAVFEGCARCNRAVLASLEAGDASEALVDLFHQKEGFLAQLEALLPLPEALGVDPVLFKTSLERLTAAQQEAALSEVQVSAALLPQIPHHGKIRNPYQQTGSVRPKNRLETEG